MTAARGPIRIAVGTWMIRYPLGGIASWQLQWLVGFHRMGHHVVLIEKSGYPNSCFDPVRQVMSADCTYGCATIAQLLARFGLPNRWGYVDEESVYHGMSRQAVEAFLNSADLLVDLGTHGSWLPEAAKTGCRVLVDGEPAFNQIKFAKRLAAGEPLPKYDFYLTNGMNVGAPDCRMKLAGLDWKPIFNPVVLDLFDTSPPPAGAPFTTVMNWQAHDPTIYEGQLYGQKDQSFAPLVDLPRRTTVPLEIAVAGRYPRQQLIDAGWRIRDAHAATAIYDGYLEYIRSSAGEFSVAKHGYVVARSGWFSDRSAAYLASGRPVIMQDTGFGCAVPTGRGLLAFNTIDGARDALDAVQGDYAAHSRAAREIAEQYLSTEKVLGDLLTQVGL